MKTGTLTSKGFRDETRYNALGLITSRTVTPIDQWVHSVVSVGPLIKGNFKDANPWSYNVEEYSYLRGYAIASSRVDLSRNIWQGALGTSSSTPTDLDYTGLITKVRENALGRLNEKVRGSLDLATSLAETGQAWKMLNLVGRFKAGLADMQRSYQREVASKIRRSKSRQSAEKAIRRWQRGLKLRHPRSYRPVPVTPGLVSRTTSLGANGWCEYTYGWSPLISDIYGIASNVVGFVRNNARVSASFIQKLDERRNLEKALDMGSSTEFYTMKVQYQGVIKAKYQIQLAPNYDQSLAKWTSLNPLSVAWELVPYSFVVDWFYDVGSYMRNLETALLYDNKFKSGFVSTLALYEGHGTALDQRNPSSSGRNFLITGNASIRRASFNRVLLFSYPLPSIPSFQVDLGWQRLLSAASLLRQKLK